MDTVEQHHPLFYPDIYKKNINLFTSIIFWIIANHILLGVQSAGASEYTNCISAEG